MTINRFIIEFERGIIMFETESSACILLINVVLLIRLLQIQWLWVVDCVNRPVSAPWPQCGRTPPRYTSAPNLSLSRHLRFSLFSFVVHYIFRQCLVGKRSFLHEISSRQIPLLDTQSKPRATPITLHQDS